MEGGEPIGISISALNNMHFLGFYVCVYEHSVFKFQPNENENYLPPAVRFLPTICLLTSKRCNNRCQDSFIYPWSDPHYMNTYAEVKLKAFTRDSRTRRSSDQTLNMHRQVSFQCQI